MILVEVHVPVIDERNDFELDENVPVVQIIEEIAAILSRKSKSNIPDGTEPFILCSLDSCKILDPEHTLYENGITDGQTLMIV